MNTILKVFESLVKLNAWQIRRFDLQSFDYGHGIEGFAAYVHIDGEKRTLIIHDNGEFEWLDK